MLFCVILYPGIVLLGGSVECLTLTHRFTLPFDNDGWAFKRFFHRATQGV